MDYKHVFPPKLAKSLKALGREDEHILTASIPQLYGGSPEFAHVVVKMLCEDSVSSRSPWLGREVSNRAARGVYYRCFAPRSCNDRLIRTYS